MFFLSNRQMRKLSGVGRAVHFALLIGVLMLMAAVLCHVLEVVGVRLDFIRVWSIVTLFWGAMVLMAEYIVTLVSDIHDALDPNKR